MAQTGTYVKDTARSLPQACDGDGTEDGYNAEMEITVTGPVTYPTGGFTLTSIATDLSKIKCGWQASSIGSSVTRSAFLVRATGLSAADTKIKVLSGTVECGAAQTLSATPFSFVLRGAGPLGS